ncbi:hypothetical protein [Micromonospora lupini]|uniref:Uncharacterized protein n=1 Tax=Micromonospora lupini str. Lupac 08 TaxID=1150864 RepID=I0L9N1_9ACTN|nr:hypothetical protein [Micromonospora lupini]CCH20528.1 conserved hypothetical protein [Micromonospora lupini str. Lupac 08]
MGPIRRLARARSALGGGARAGAARLVRVPRRSGRPGADRDRSAAAGWEVVTVDRPPEQVLPDGRWPEPLDQLDGVVEVRVRPAPGDRGTELAARPLDGAAAPAGLAAHLVGDDPGLLVRRTLRQVKQRVEAGEVLRADRSALDRRTARG